MLSVGGGAWSGFKWSNLLPSNSSCGLSKCFFPSSQVLLSQRGSSIQQPNTRTHVGWLVAEGTMLKLGIWNRTWGLAQALHTRFGVRHTLIGAPRLIPLPAQEAAYLNAHLTKFIQEFHISKRYTSGTVLVQPVASCGWPSCLFLGCGSGPKGRYFKARLPEFLAHVPDKARFEGELTKNIRSTQAMMKAMPRLQTDFQAMLRYDGVILHIDLDRSDQTVRVSRLTNHENEWTYGCLDSLPQKVHEEASRIRNRSLPLPTHAHTPHT